MPIGELQRLLRDGRRFDTVVPPLLEMIQTLQAGSTNPTPQKTSTARENYRQRRGEAVAAAGLNGKPAFALTATPLRPTTLPTLFRGASDPLVRLVENPPELRVHGFDLNAGDSSEIVRVQLRRAFIPHRLLFECWPDGTLILTSPAGQTYVTTPGSALLFPSLCYSVGGMPAWRDSVDLQARRILP